MSGTLGEISTFYSFRGHLNRHQSALFGWNGISYKYYANAPQCYVISSILLSYYSRNKQPLIIRYIKRYFFVMATVSVLCQAGDTIHALKL